MARSRTVVESVTCDLCGKPIASRDANAIAFGSERWELDLCDKDLAAMKRQIGQWTSRARRVSPTRRRTGKQAAEEWSYLELLGFKRHRGRKSAAEAAALARR